MLKIKVLQEKVNRLEVKRERLDTQIDQLYTQISHLNAKHITDRLSNSLLETLHETIGASYNDYFDRNKGGIK